MKRNLKIAFLMDPFEKLDLKGDTTFALALEAQARKHEISFFKPDDLFLKSGQVFANICKIELSSQNETHDYRYHDEKTSSLNHYDVVLMRQDPPFNMSYITATHILEKLSSSVLVVNNPYDCLLYTSPSPRD